jgi:hypothetical protein
MVLALATLGPSGTTAAATDPVVLTSSPTPSPTATPTFASPTTPPSLQFDWDNHASFTWEAIPRASRYHLTGSVGAVRTNAARPFCDAPLVQDTRNVNLDENLAAGDTTFRVPLPPIPPVDEWFVNGAIADLTATDENGAVLSTGHVGFLYETYGACPVLVFPTAPNALPGTGGGFDSSSLAQLLNELLLFVAGALTTFAGFRVRRRHRLTRRKPVRMGHSA